ncbi:unnamed protein product [Spirodela intermedia]|uniref:U-box domain-containing protein n=1 Tax=Spirodela intermedia TaxID=51605 RepID=A0A7I8KS03_SPIIN|nr:unnamed protein product [Spirodela intermedia]
MEEKGIEVPIYFLCPISLQIMRDPVTLSTGVTYDRESIERWVFSGDNEVTCPMTKQLLPDPEIIPNHTLRRLIQGWCVANAASGVERFPTPRAPVSKAQMAQLLDESTAAASPTQLAALRKLRSIVGESERNRRTAESAGAPHLLVSIIRRSAAASSAVDGCTGSTSGSALEEALTILHTLQVSPQGFSELVERNGDLVEIFTEVLRSSSYQTRAYAVILLQSITQALPLSQLVNLKKEIFEELKSVVNDQISLKASKAALRVLSQLSIWGKNRAKATKAGGVGVILELLLDEQDGKVCEMAMVVLDQLCGCAEGRAELVGHPAGIAVVSKKILRVSQLATERAVKVLYSVAKFSAAPAVVQEMLHVGVVSKLCLLLQLDCGSKTKEKTKEILRLHARMWKDSPCIPPLLQASYACY